MMMRKKMRKNCQLEWCVRVTLRGEKNEVPLAVLQTESSLFLDNLIFYSRLRYPESSGCSIIPLYSCPRYDTTKTFTKQNSTARLECGEKETRLWERPFLHTREQTTRKTTTACTRNPQKLRFKWPRPRKKERNRFSPSTVDNTQPKGHKGNSFVL